MIKKEHFDPELQELALLAKALSHPARLAILQYLAKTKTCISGNITDYIPLSRTTVSQHLKELKDLGLIQGEVDGLKVNLLDWKLNINRIWDINFQIMIGLK